MDEYPPLLEKVDVPDPRGWLLLSPTQPAEEGMDGCDEMVSRVCVGQHVASHTGNLVSDCLIQYIMLK